MKTPIEVIRVKYFLVVLIALFFVAGCGQNGGETENGESTRGYDIIKDSVYGCEYISLQASYSSPTPRLDKNGNQVGCTK